MIRRKYSFVLEYGMEFCQDNIDETVVFSRMDIIAGENPFPWPPCVFVSADSYRCRRYTSVKSLTNQVGYNAIADEQY